MAGRNVLPSLALLLFGGAAGEAQSPAPELPVQKPIIPRCPPAAGAEDIVVCGSRSRSETYRIPEILREDSAPSEASWGARRREFDEDQRYGDSTVGPGGYLKEQRQMIREWRQEREEMARQRRERTRQIEEAGR